MLMMDTEKKSLSNLIQLMGKGIDVTAAQGLIREKTWIF